MNSNKKLKIVVNGAVCEASFNKETKTLSYCYDSTQYFTNIDNSMQLFDFIAEGISIYDAWSASYFT